MSHLEARLEHDINKIRAQMAEQSQEVIRAVKDAVHALQTGNKPLAYDTILRDHPINRQMREIDRICHRFIAVHLPSAGHLRLLSAVIRVNIELERIGDYAVTIAREGVQMSAPPSGVMARELERCDPANAGPGLQGIQGTGRKSGSLNHSAGRPDGKQPGRTVRGDDVQRPAP